MPKVEHPNRHWLRKWLRGEPHLVIGGSEDPYMLRWYVLPRNRFANIYLHKFMRSDDDRALHDHPWWWASVLLNGTYIEHRDDGSATKRKRGSVVWRKPEVLHRVELEPAPVWNFEQDTFYEKPCWTLFFTGPKLRKWGFACPEGWKVWEQFDHDGGCGEPQ